MAEQLSIPEFFRDKNVFITGGSGFIGKVLVEKLLRSCCAVKAIYLLMRAKKGKSPKERIQAITDLALFDVLKRQDAEAVKKIRVVHGDASELGLGLSPEDARLLIEEVNVVFHGAASVRFDDSLTDAVILNTRGTREMVNLALKMKKLDAFVHISTTYCNTDRPVIEEKLYPPHANWAKTIQIVEEIDRHTLDILTPKLISPFPNTYTFAKSLAEHVVHDLGGFKIPVVIFRPSVVISTAEDPFPGWMDNFNGPVGLLVACGKGVIRVVYADPDLNADFVPVDVIVKALIISSWKKGIDHSQGRLEPNFYNGSQNDIMPTTSGELVKMGKPLCEEVPLDDIIWYPNGGVTKCYYNYLLKMLFYQLLPAIIFDTLLTILGKKPLLVKLQRRVYVANMALKFFTFNSWKFVNDEVLKLKTHLLPCDVDSFSFNEEALEPYTYFVEACKGGRKYILKEGEDLGRAKKHANRMWILAQVFNLVWYAGLFWLVFIKIDIVSLLLNKLNEVYIFFTTD